MAVNESVQIEINGLALGKGTAYGVGMGFNPFDRTVRAGQSGPRPWGHGSWSGSEWSEEAVVPIPLVINTSDRASWMEARHVLQAAFGPVGDSGQETELQFTFGGRKYVMFGRPRAAEYPTLLTATGTSFARCAFVALDPRIYDATETSATFGLPTFEGGLTVPFTVPFTIDAVPVDGQADLTNEGTTATGLTLRIDGPVPEPRVTVQGPAGTAETLRYLGDVPSGRFLLIDTAKRTALVDGLPQANRRGQVAGDWPLLPGNPDGSGATSTILFRASNNEAAGTLTASARSAWW